MFSCFGAIALWIGLGVGSMSPLPERSTAAFAQTEATVSPAAAAEDSPEAHDNPDRPRLEPGMQGEVVEELQVRLQLLGYYSEELTSEYDEATIAAVKAFQADQELEPTGIFDAAAFEKLAAIPLEDAPNAEPPDSPGLSRRQKLLLLGVGGLLGVVGLGAAVAYFLFRFVNRDDPDWDEDEMPLAAIATPSAQMQLGPIHALTPVEPTVDATAVFATTPTPDLANPPMPTPSSAGRSEVLLEDAWQGPSAVDAIAPLLPSESTVDPTATEDTETVRQESAEPTESLSQPPPATVAAAPSSTASRAVPPTQPPTRQPVAPSPPSTALSSPPLTNGYPYPSDALTLQPPPAALPKADLVEELVRELQSTAPEKRQRAIWELAQKGDSRAVQPLVNLLLDSDSQQQSLVLEALSQIGVRTLKPINRALALSLQDDSAQVRKNAIRDVARVYELIAQLSQLIYFATDDPDPDVQETAKWALSQLNHIRLPQPPQERH